MYRHVSVSDWVGGFDIPIRLGKKVQQLNQHRPQRRLALALLLCFFRAPAFSIQQHLVHLLRRQHLVAQIQRHHRRLGRQHLIPKHLRRRLGVNHNVKLGKRGDVANPLLATHVAQLRAGKVVAKRAAHEAQAFNVAGEVRVLPEQGGDVGEGARGDEPGRVGGLRGEGGGHGVDGGDGGGLDGGRREEVGAVEAALAVDVGRMDGGALEGLGEADVQRDLVLLADGGEDRGGVLSGVPE